MRDLPKDKIDELKSRDPIFRKRYHQYEISKFSDKVPQFDSSDTQSFVISKMIPNNFSIQKRKKEIISQQQNMEANKSSQIFQSEMQFLREKTKSFIDSINDSF